MSRIDVFQRGESVPIWVLVRTNAGVYVDPTQGVDVTLSEPDGTIAQDGDSADIEDTAMTRSEEGKYVYYYNSADDDPTKKWNYKCIAIDGEGDGERKTITHGGFRLT